MLQRQAWRYRLRGSFSGHETLTDISAVEYRSQFAILVTVLALIAFEPLMSLPAMFISPYNFILRGTWVIAR
jgi:hypothetical protein